MDRCVRRSREGNIGDFETYQNRLYLAIGDKVYVRIPHSLDVSITNPSENSTVEGDVLLKSSVITNGTIDNVTYRIDGQSYEAIYEASYDPMTNNWTYLWNTSSLPEGNYTVELIVNLTNGQRAEDNITIEVRRDRPFSTIVHPSPGLTNIGPMNISGTAEDNISGVKVVYISIQNLDTAQYWNGTAWTQSERWLKANGTTSWRYNTSNVDWIDGNYTIKSRAVDNATIWEDPPFELSITIDSTGPVSSIEDPPPGSLLQQIETIRGTAIDSLSTIGAVYITILRVSDSMYWNGDGWQPDQEWIYVSNEESWTYDCTDVEWVDGEYLIGSRSVDSLGNMELSPNMNSVVVDSSPPLSTISFPSDGIVISAVDEIRGETSDNLSGIDYVEISIERVVDRHYWNSTSWTMDEVWIVANGTVSWRYNTSSIQWIDGEYIIQSRAVDNATNTQSNIHSVQITIDRTAPVVNILYPIEGEKFRRGREYSILWRATDPHILNSSVNISYSTDGGSTWVLIAINEENDGSFLWRTPYIDGDVIIRIEVRDAAGNIGVGITDPFTISQPPSSTEQWWTLLILGIVIGIVATILLRTKREEEVEPPPSPVIGRAESPTLCGICLGTIKSGLSIVKCGSCGKSFHDSCAARVKTCPVCDSEMDMDNVVMEGE